MYSYLIDELKPREIERIVHYLDYYGYKGPIRNIYWIEIPDHLLNPTQKDHASECGPYILSLETGKTWIKLELLVRPRNTLRCTCMALATPEQRDYGLNIVDHILMDLGLVE